MNDRSESAHEAGKRTPTHDQICTFDPNLCRDCILQAEARADEREQAAQRMEAIMRYWTEGKEFLFADWEIRNITNAARGGEQA